MSYLSLNELCPKETEELHEEEQRLFDALLNSTVTQLSHLTLNDNALWFRHDEARESLINYIKRQTKLNQLYLQENRLSD